MVPSQAISPTMHLCPASPSHHTLWSTAREMKGDTKKTDGPATYACIASSPAMTHESPRTLPSPVAIEASTVTMHEKAPQRHHIIISWNINRIGCVCVYTSSPTVIYSNIYFPAVNSALSATTTTHIYLYKQACIGIFVIDSDITRRNE
jgi:hypothetical protein